MNKSGWGVRFSNRFIKVCIKLGISDYKKVKSWLKYLFSNGFIRRRIIKSLLCIHKQAEVCFSQENCIWLKELKFNISFSILVQIVSELLWCTSIILISKLWLLAGLFHSYSSKIWFHQVMLIVWNQPLTFIL